MVVKSQITSKPLSSSPQTTAQLRQIIEQNERELQTHKQAITDRDNIIADRDNVISDRDNIIIDRDHIIAEQQKRLKLLEELLRLSQQRRFGASSEKCALQVDMFDEAELEMAIGDVEEQLPEQDQETKRKPRKPRRGFSEKLPRERINLPLTDEQKAGASKTFFTKVKEELDIIPAKARVLEYWQERAVFDKPDGSQQIEAAPRSTHPLGKCIASVGLLAYILVAKYADHLPLYRLERILKRYGGQISRTAMANWIIRLDAVFQPLINLLQEQQLSANYLQADETRLQVLKEDGMVATSDKWMWLVRGGPPDRPAVLFHYSPSRAEKVPLRLLDGFEGVLQADGYSGYNKVCEQNPIKRIGCWDHARRKFVEASKAMPAKKKGKKASKADVAISKIGQLYRIERKIAGLAPEQKAEQREKLSRPALDDLHSWLETHSRRVPKDSLTYKAIYYTLNQWERLIGYCDDGHLMISNALAENAIRPFAVGRKNWLFAHTPRGAKASATVYSLIETAKANGLEPYEYLQHILSRMGDADTVEKIEALLPWNVKGKI